MSVSFRIRVTGNGPFKLKFLPGTPRAKMEEIQCRLKTGGKVTIPAALCKYIDTAHLDRCNTLGVVSVKRLHSEASAPVIPPEPPRKNIRPKQGGNKDPKKGSKSQKGGD